MAREIPQRVSTQLLFVKLFSCGPQLLRFHEVNQLSSTRSHMLALSHTFPLSNASQPTSGMMSNKKPHKSQKHVVTCFAMCLKRFFSEHHPINCRMNEEKSRFDGFVIERRLKFCFCASKSEKEEKSFCGQPGINRNGSEFFALHWAETLLFEGSG